MPAWVSQFGVLLVFIFFFNDTATTEIYTLSLHDALPISCSPPPGCRSCREHRCGEEPEQVPGHRYALNCVDYSIAMGSNRNRTVSERSVTPPITRGSAVALCRPLRMLRPRPLRGIRWPRPTRRTRRSTAGSPAPQRPARSVPTDVLDEGMPGDDHFGVTVLLEAAHRRNRAFSLPWSHSTCLLASRSVRFQVAGSSC